MSVVLVVVAAWVVASVIAATAVCALITAGRRREAPRPPRG